MRLINTDEERLVLKEFWESDLPPYAVLSHCWGAREQEVSLQQFEAGANRDSPGFEKIKQCCALARSQGLSWAWVDTCCIDKTSSAELSEAINSMYNWYKWSAVCYVFVNDFEVTIDQNASLENTNFSRELSDNPQRSPDPLPLHARLARCRWFTRGWTLQELLAPRRVQFYDGRLRQFGTRETLSEAIAAVTTIDVEYLSGSVKLEQACVAQKMSWVSKRLTTRREDLAYCLLGIFDVNMPLLYGEGLEKAFYRLQERIIAKSTDETIFAWRSSEPRDGGLVARYPEDFARSGRIRRQRNLRGPGLFRLTNRGVEIDNADGTRLWGTSFLSQLNILTTPAARDMMWGHKGKGSKLNLACSETSEANTSFIRPGALVVYLRRREADEMENSQLQEWYRVRTDLWEHLNPDTLDLRASLKFLRPPLDSRSHKLYVGPPEMVARLLAAEGRWIRWGRPIQVCCWELETWWFPTLMAILHFLGAYGMVVKADLPIVGTAILLLGTTLVQRKATYCLVVLVLSIISQYMPTD